MGRAATLLVVLAALVGWYEAAPHVGVRTQAFALTLAPSGSTFAGGWHFTGHTQVTRWTGSRRGGGTGWAGTWDAHSAAGNDYVLFLHQSGAHVTGTLRKPDGATQSLEATRAGRTITFAERAGGWSLWPSILLIAFVLIPACFLLLWLALPLWSWRWTWAGALVSVGLAALCSVAGFPVGSNFCKLAAMTFLGWFFLSFFEEVSWVVIVALLIPWVDIYSVFAGPTKALTNGAHQDVFGTLSVAFLVPGGGAARLGLPDILFFSVFLGAAARFRLRPFWTWIGLTLGVSLTIVCATWWNVAGLPALPGISLGFLLPNADLLVRRLRLRPRGDRADVAVD